MAGLIEQGMRQAPQYQQTREQPQVGDAEEKYKRLGFAAMKLIYSKPESDHVIEILRGSANNPAEAIAQAAFAVISRMQQDIQGIDKKLAYAVAPVLLMLLLEMGVKAEIITEEAIGESDTPDTVVRDAMGILADLAKTQEVNMQPGEMTGG